MQLIQIRTLKATLILETGLHIGAGDSQMSIGGTDNPVIKHPQTNEPYIPGSSLKGKIRSLLEWRSGAVREKPLGLADAQGPQARQVRDILSLFGVSGSEQMTLEQAQAIGPTRLGFWDCALIRSGNNADVRAIEIKMETAIDRISGTAKNGTLRTTERVPAGARFDFRLSLKVLDQDKDALLPTVLAGLKLLELDSLGGSGSRGYGKVRFENLTLDDQPQTLPNDPFKV